MTRHVLFELFIINLLLFDEEPMCVYNHDLYATPIGRTRDTVLLLLIVFI